MTDTTNLGLPYIDAAQAQKHVTHNEALQTLDALVQLAVLDRDLAAPPGAPSAGQRWIVAASPTGAWAGHATHVAAWQDGGWHFSVPKTGWTAYVVDEGTLLVWNGSAWGDFFSTVTSIQNLARLGIGTTADAANPVSAKLNNTLWVAKTVAEGGDGNLRYKLSKESASKTLSFLFQDNFSGRAEFGLTGDDNFHIKVSPDGSSWKEALGIDVASGQVGLGTASPTQLIDAVGSAAALAIWDNRSYAAGRGGSVLLQASNDTPARFTAASVAAYATTGAHGAEVADLVLSSMKAGTLTEALRLLGAGTAVFAAGASFAGAVALTTASATAFAVGRLGATTPALLVDASTASSITGFKIKSAASGGGVALSAIGETNVNVALDAAGSGTLTLNGTATGAVTTPRVFNITNTTAATSTTTGALKVAGGAGVAGDLWLGGILTMPNSGFIQPTNVLHFRDVSNNTRCNFRLMPHGTEANVPAVMEFFGTDYISDGSNWNRICFRSCGTSNTYNQIVADAAGTGAAGTVHGIQITVQSATGLVVNTDGGVTAGSPTGGSKGDGTINATAVYDDNVLLTCFGIEFLLDGRIDLGKWDAHSPSGRNELVHRFASLVDGGFDPRDHRQYIGKMRSDRALPGMPTEIEWRHNAMPLGEIHNRLWLSTELLASAFVGSHTDHERRIAALESRIQ
jgi:hypothetical protein